MYANGRGVNQDFVQAYAWFNLAASAGHDTARDNLSFLKEEMTPTELNKGKALSQQLIKKYRRP